MLFGVMEAPTSWHDLSALGREHPGLLEFGPQEMLSRGFLPLSKIQLRRDKDGVWIDKSTLLPGCHAHGRDRDEAIFRFQLAAKAHLEALRETGRPIPPAFRDKFVLIA
ncbi:MAG: type II toxin-antitoxin system HicB family antitoxin [Verrucomicrobia bacterium]|nr:type II toxin-antitoxin system HicB family antitoxin [Verrucomicrobiota bacterium]